MLVGSAMFGEEEYEQQLIDLVGQLGISDRVDFCGFVHDVPKFLMDVDILVHASVIPEPFGQVVVEGMAAGLAVVASDAGGPAEVITHEVDGLLYPPEISAHSPPTSDDLRTTRHGGQGSPIMQYARLRSTKLRTSRHNVSKSTNGP